MRELSVYDGGAWKTPGYAYVYRGLLDGWVRVNEIHIFRNNEFTKVWDQGTLYVPSSATVLKILRASQSRQPDADYWRNTYINGRRLGDINNSGSVTSTDASLMSSYVIDPALVTSDQRQWIEVAIIPYATDYPPP